MLYKSRKEFHKFVLKWPLIVRLWFSTYDVVHRLSPEHPLHMFLAWCVSADVKCVFC